MFSTLSIFFYHIWIRNKNMKEGKTTYLVYNFPTNAYLYTFTLIFLDTINVNYDIKI